MIAPFVRGIGWASRRLAARHPFTDPAAISAVARALGIDDARAAHFLQFRKTASDQAWTLVWLLARIRFFGLRWMIGQTVRFPDSESWDRLAADRRPCILAAPHLGGYAFAFPAIAERLADKRVMVFYDDLQANASNAVFDDLVRAARRWLPNFEVVHNTRCGLVHALKALQQDSCLIIMPDIRSSEAASELVPFFGHYFPIALGTAQIAERTGAAVYPIVTPIVAGRVHCRLGVEACSTPAMGASARHFALMRDVFAQFESLLVGEAEQWDYWSAFPQHHDTVPPFLPGPRSGLDPHMERAVLDEVRRLVAGTPELALQVPELGEMLRNADRSSLSGPVSHT